MGSVPDKLNLGSGKDFREDYLNLDISDYWQPDIVADITHLFRRGDTESFETRRFGAVTLEKESFSEIIANDVLEHIPDLVSAMTQCLSLLKTGGKFNIYVPYDLSYGAWQDPTHVRAFNERSWLYYTDWFWYIGWSQARFKQADLQFGVSPLGQALQQKGMSLEMLLATPRAVDGMWVTLEKIPLSDQDKHMLEKAQAQRRR